MRVGSEHRTYGEIHDGVLRISAALRDAGVRPEERVLIVLPDGFEFVEAWFATLRVGAVFAMVNPLLKTKDYAYYLDYSRAAAVFTHESVLPEIGDALRSAAACRAAFVVGEDAGGFTPYEEARRAADPSGEGAAAEPVGPDGIAGWLFTSGSTGEP